jgi:anaerobic glycerol-3-phosphate dehydrogenase
MAWKQLALAAALLGVAIPSEAFDTRNESQQVMFYYAFPLDAHSKKERISWLGLQIQGKRDYQSFNVDTRLFSFAEGGSTAANLAIVGAVAVGAAVMVSQRGKSAQQETAQQQQATQQAQQQQQQQKPPAQPCPQACP